MEKKLSGALCGIFYSIIFFVFEYIYFFIMRKSDSKFSNFFIHNTWGAALHMLFIFVLPYIAIIASLWIVQKSEDMKYSCKIAGIVAITFAVIFTVILLFMKQMWPFVIAFNMFMFTGGIRFINFQREKKIRNISL